MRTRRSAAGLGCCLAVLLAGCQSLPASRPMGGAVFNGRLAVQVQGDAQRSFSSSFELLGDARTGSMTFTSPLGSLVGRATWTADGAVRLDTGDAQHSYTSLSAMAQELTGQDLPIAALFDWLEGRPWPDAPHETLAPDTGTAGFAQLGWDVLLDRRTEGLIVAIRRLPPPQVTVRARLDAP